MIKQQKINIIDIKKKKTSVRVKGNIYVTFLLFVCILFSILILLFVPSHIVVEFIQFSSW